MHRKRERSTMRIKLNGFETNWKREQEKFQKRRLNNRNG